MIRDAIMPQWSSPPIFRKVSNLYLAVDDLKSLISITHFIIEHPITPAETIAKVNQIQPNSLSQKQQQES